MNVTGLARACGKVILVGEHAVVYGWPAIAVGIQRGAEAQARSAGESVLRVGLSSARPGDGSELGAAFAALLGELGVAEATVEVSLELPPGCGLGASAAVAVAVARSITQIGHESGTGESPSTRIFRAAQAWERVFHGNPSGIDATAAVYGGCFSYVRGKGATGLPLSRELTLVLGIAGPPASTRDMVELVARRRAEYPHSVDRILEDMGRLATQAQGLLVRGELERLGQVLNENQEHLEELGVSTSAIRRACKDAQRAGAWGAKLTGSGGGGAVMALVDEDATPVLSAWKSGGLACFATRVAPGGALTDSQESS